MRPSSGTSAAVDMMGTATLHFFTALRAALALVVTARETMKPEEKEKKKRPPFSLTVRRIIGLAKPEAGRLAVATFFLLVAGSANLVFPIGVGSIVNGAVGSGAKGSLVGMLEHALKSGSAHQ